MATTTWYANKDARIARRMSDNWDSGAGASNFNPVGYYYYNGSYWRYRTLIGFNQTVPFSSMISITSAVLHIRTSTQYYVAFGSDPDTRAYRITSSWNEGSSVDLSGSNAVIYPGPSIGSAYGLADISPNEQTWDTIDVTSVLQEAKANNSWYGIELRANDESATSDLTEIYSSETSSEPYLVVTYTTNTPPNPPTNLQTYNATAGVWQSGAVSLQGAVDDTSESGHAITSLTFPPLYFQHSDPQGDGMSYYRVQIDNDSNFASPVWDSGYVASAGPGVWVYPPGTYSRGTTYYWRCLTRDNVETGVDGAWSTESASFTANVLPTVTITSPSSSGASFAEITNLATDTTPWTLTGQHARARVRWSPSESQTAFIVVLSGAHTHNSGVVWSASARSYDIPVGLVHNNEYSVTVQVRDGNGEWGAASSAMYFKVRWGQVRFETAGGSGSSTGYNFTAGSVLNGTAAYFFDATAASGGTVTTWKTAITSVTPNNYFTVMVRLAASTPGTSPTLGSMTFTRVDAPAVEPDHWYQFDTTGTAHMTIDKSVRRYGTQAPRVYLDTNSGSAHTCGLIPFVTSTYSAAGAKIAVQPNTRYVLSAYVRTKAPDPSNSSTLTGNPVLIGVRDSTDSAWLLDGETGAQVKGAVVANPATDRVSFRGATLDSGADCMQQDGWLRLALPFTTPNTSDVVIRICRDGTGGTVGESYWVDAVKLEEGRVPAPWSPGFVANAVVLDAGGLIIDASAGGVFRVMGSSGGLRDTVEVGANGLVFGGDIEMYSPSAGRITIKDNSPNNAEFAVGDDTTFFDADIAHFLGIKSVSTAANGGFVFGSDKDTNLYRNGADILKTDDDFQAKTVALGTNKVARYVPLSSFISVIDAEAYSASDSAIQTSAEITGLPSTGVVAVVCLVILNASSVAGGNYVTLFNYGTTDTAQYAVSCIMAPAVTYNHSIQGIISTGGTNNRQIKYFRNRSAGTVTWYLRIVGYWTTE